MGNGYCFVCGQKSDVGLKLEFKVSKSMQKAICTTILSDKYRGWTGFLHGGIIASILDGAMVYACKAIDLKCVTAELSIKYKNPIPVNTEIEIIAEVKNKIPFLAYTESNIKIDGKVVVEAKAKMLSMDYIK
jgi:acyl-coenzyme A thioesterase PaaI-like protein